MPARSGTGRTLINKRRGNGFDIILLVGQSNMAGHGINSPTIDVNQTGVYQYGGDPAFTATYRLASSTIVPLGDPDGVTFTNNYVGPGQYIGRQYSTNTGRRTLVVPTAWGGTHLASSPFDWAGSTTPGAGGARFEFAITQALGALAAARAIDASSQIVGICSLQGEADGAANVSEATYLTALQNEIICYRARLNTPNAWVVLGGMVPEVITANPALSYEAIDMAHGECARVGTGVAFVRGPAGFTTDDLHYTVGAVRIIGPAMANAANVGAVATPTTFTFTAITSPVSTQQTSNKITVAGLSPGRSVAVSVTGGNYRKNGHTWRSDANSAVNDDTFELQVTSSASASTATNTVLTIGGVSGTYTVTTNAAGSPSQFVFRPYNDAVASSTQTSNTVTMSGIGAFTPAVSVTGGLYSKNGGAFTSSATTAVDGDTFAVQGTASGTAGGTTSVTLTVGGTSNTYVITTATVTYTAESVTYFNAMSVAPSSTQKGYLDTLIAGLKTDGLWAKIDWLYILAAHDSQAGLLNAKSPGSFTLNPVGSPTFTAFQGYTGSGGTCYLDTGWAPSTNGVNFTQNLASMGAYVRSALQGTIGCMGTRLSSDINLNPFNASSVMAIKLNSASAASTSTTVAAKGLKAMDRYASTNFRALQAGAQVGTNLSNTSQALSANTICLLGVNSQFAAHQLGFAFAGTSLTVTEHGNLYSRVNAYLTSVGGL